MRFVHRNKPDSSGASWAIFVVYWAIASFFVKRDVTARRWWRSPEVRNAVIIFIIIFVMEMPHHGMHRRLTFFDITVRYPVFGAVGTALCVLGIALAIWARVYLGPNWSPVPTLKKEHELVVSGPYRVVRHPIYTGMLMASLGTALVSPPWAVALVIFAVIFVRRVGIEERLMLAQFPTQYPRYRERTWALLPWVW